jgi:hypothetical protein
VVVACHVVLVLPFVLRSVYVSLRNLDQRLELAAASLGAPPLRVLMTVTMPLLAPGLVSGWLFAAILSFNEFTASLFVTAQRTQTLPVAMYNYVREYADPSMAALSVMYIVATATLLIIANLFLGSERCSTLKNPLRLRVPWTTAPAPPARARLRGTARGRVEALRRRGGAARSVTRCSPRRDSDAARALRRRQDDASQPRRRLPPARQRRDPYRRASRSRTCRPIGARSACCSRITRCSHT